jgi:hypothetical protein
MTNTRPTAEPIDDSIHMNNASDPINLNDLVSDLDGDPLTIEIVTQPSHGTLVENPDGTYSYHPDEGYVGPDSFSYKVTDGERVAGGEELVYITADATAMLTNALPVANDSTAEGFSNSPIPGTLDFQDTPNGEGGYIDPLTVKLVGAVDGVLTTAAGGTVTLVNGNFVYVPPEGFVGQDSFTYAVTDGELQGGEPIYVTGEVTVIVNPQIPPAPLPDIIAWEVGGCPALMEWLADELGEAPDKVQSYGLSAVSESQNAVGTGTSIAYKGDIQLCQLCAQLKNSAQVLMDPNGISTGALASVIAQAGPLAGPPTPEQMDAIAAALAEAAKDTQYASAPEFVEAVVTYVTTLTNNLGYDVADAVALFMENHGAPITADESVDLYIGVLLSDITAQLEPTGP